MLRMPSEHCQAGKGYLKRTVLVQAGSNWDAKRNRHSGFAFLQADLIEKIDA